jgi:hypothetical protein
MAFKRIKHAQVFFVLAFFTLTSPNRFSKKKDSPLVFNPALSLKGRGKRMTEKN